MKNQKNMNSRTYVLSGAVLGLAVVLVLQILFKEGLTSTAFAATSVSGTSVSTTSLIIDATGTPTSSQTGIIDLDVTTAAGAVNVAGQDMVVNMGATSIPGAASIAASGYMTTINGPSAGLAQWNMGVGNFIVISSNSTSDSVNGSYVGNVVLSRDSLLSTGSFTGYRVDFPDTVFNGEDAMTGALNGYTASLFKNAGSGDVVGSNYDLKNLAGSSAGNLIGINMGITLDATPTSSSYGLIITKTGSGTLTDGIKVAGTSMTDAIDVSTAGATNALHLGTDSIVISNGATTLDIGGGAVDGSAKNLTITNSNPGSAIANVLIEGGLQIGNSGSNPGTLITKHLEAGAAFNPTSIAGQSCQSTVIGAAGFAVGDVVIASPTASTSGVESMSLMWNAWVASPDNVGLRICNPTSSPLDPGDEQWKFDVWQH